MFCPLGCLTTNCNFTFMNDCFPGQPAAVLPAFRLRASFGVAVQAHGCFLEAARDVTLEVGFRIWRIQVLWPVPQCVRQDVLFLSPLKHLDWQRTRRHGIYEFAHLFLQFWVAGAQIE
jgi:hypothetical protein